MYLQPEEVLQLLLAVAAGGLLGLEREFRDKAAGFRTLMLICAGSALFTIISRDLAGANNDPTRIAAQIVSGVGFLGVGVIVRDSGRIIGLTTAAAIWLTAAIGMTLGGGDYALAGAATLTALVVLWLFPRLEAFIASVAETATYEVQCAPDSTKLAEVEALFRQHGLRVKLRGRFKTAEAVGARWEAQGAPRRHAQVTQALLADAEVLVFRLNDRVTSG